MATDREYVIDMEEIEHGLTESYSQASGLTIEQLENGEDETLDISELPSGNDSHLAEFFEAESINKEALMAYSAGNAKALVGSPLFGLDPAIILTAAFCAVWQQGYNVARRRYDRVLNLDLDESNDQ